MIRHILAATTLALASLAAQATITTYNWTIDWQNGGDQSGTLVFDDLGDSSPQSFNWFYSYGTGRNEPPPNVVEGLPPIRLLGSLTFDGSFVTSLRGCNDIIAVCHSSAFVVASGFISSDFSLSGNGTAMRATFAGGNGDQSCQFPSLGFTLPPKCFAFDTGVTTFTAVTLTSPVPEPATWALMLAGLLGITLLLRRRGAVPLAAGVPA